MTEPSTYRYDVFISYCHADQEWVQRELLPRLESAGLRVCIDYRDFEIGVPSLINMERAVDDSRHTLAVLTPKYIASEWCEFELLLGGTRDPAGRRRKLFPLLLEACSLPTRMGLLTYVDFSDESQRVAEFDRLLDRLRETTTPGHPAIQDASPFIAGAPITHPRHFFGQGRVVKRLFNLLKRHPLHNTAIIGPRRSGKTSLLLHLKNLTAAAIAAPDQLRADQRTNLLPQPERYRWAFVDFQYSQFGERENLLHHILSELGFGIPSPCDMKGFMEVMRRNLHVPTVILLDEVDVALQRYPALDDSFWDDLRNLATYQVAGNLSFVLASCDSPKQMARRSGVGSPFFNIFAFTEKLGPLTESEALALIASSPMPFAADDVEWILTKSGRWPILLQILCSERLFALEEEVLDEDWRERGLCQIESYDHLQGG